MPPAPTTAGPLSTHPGFRWKECAPSQHVHEQVAFDWLKSALSAFPVHVWTNAEFVARSGNIRELDAVVLGPSGFFVLEIKSHPGTLEGYGREWVFRQGGGIRTLDNPLYLTNLKCKELKSLLEPGLSRLDRIYLQAAVFLSNLQLQTQLEENDRAWICGATESPAVQANKLNDVVSLLAKGTTRWPGQKLYPIDKTLLAKLTRLLDKSLLRKQHKDRQVGSFRLTGLLDEGLGYQDWLGVHQTNPRNRTRVRVYLGAAQDNDEQRSRLQRSAQREFDLLTPLKDVPGLPKAQDFLIAEEGPCILFAYEESAKRLDHWLRENEAGLSAIDRLMLLRRVAEILQRAHRSRLLHRALQPSSVLVRQGPPNWDLEVIHWQTARREGTRSDSLPETGTLHPELLIEAPGQVYLAPELLAGDQGSEASDVFGLGALAWRLFTGNAPGASLADRDRMVSQTGELHLSAIQDGVLPELDRLVAEATAVDVHCRQTLDGFLDTLDACLSKLQLEDQNLQANPLEARKDDRLLDQVANKIWTVDARLGQGATAIGLRVLDHDGKKSVLKLARDPQHNELLRKEAQTLASLSGGQPNIVGLRGTCEFQSPHGILLALVLEDAGQNLSDYLRQNAQTTVSDLERWGEDLLLSMEALETAGVFHRDIKPDNLAIQNAEENTLKRKRLMLFDFSLTTAPLDNTRVGTAGYTDPTLVARRPLRFDSMAERWSAVATLHEMATGVVPRHENGALVLACERVSTYREQFQQFFEIALSLDVKRRPSSARALRLEWLEVFKAGRAAEQQLPQELQRRSAEESGPDDHLSLLDLDTGATEALVRNHICTVRELVTQAPSKLYALKGIGGGPLRDKVRAYRARLVAVHPDLEESAKVFGGGEVSSLTQGLTNQEQGTLDHHFDVLLQNITGEEERKYILAQLGLLVLPDLPVWKKPLPELPVATASHPWSKARDLAENFGVTPAALSIPFNKAKEQWRKQGRYRNAAQTIHSLLHDAGGVMAADDLARAFLHARGTHRADFHERRVLSRGILRVLLEVETLYEEPGFRMVRQENLSLVVLSGMPDWEHKRGNRKEASDSAVPRWSLALSNWVQSLGEVARKLVEEWPLPSRARVLDHLFRVNLDRTGAPETLPRVAPRRMLELAAHSSGVAAVDPREELYPRNLPATRMLSLLLGSFPERSLLDRPALEKMRQSRFPESLELPERPALDGLMESLGLDFCATPDGYQRSSHGGSSFQRSRTQGPTEVVDVDARLVRTRLEDSLTRGGFLAVQVHPYHYPQAFAKLRREHPNVQMLDLDTVLLDELQNFCRDKNVRWENLLLADSMENPTAWDRLLQVVRSAEPMLEARLQSITKSVLLVHAGQWVRYGLQHLLERHLYQRAGTPGLHAAWLLLPNKNPSDLPCIDSKPVPIVGPQQRLELSHAYLNS
ncbi:MAG: BREX system serine/threonine kinase PglW [Fibrobacteres bacterium]|nr:BREX system serine/threonine kinase PglW [Fibrobacterota bacterium]